MSRSKGRGLSTGFRLGDHNALCDRCQSKFWASDLKEEWTGLMVCESCHDPRHPQEFLKGYEDKQNVSWSRPDSDADTNVTTVDGESLVTINSPDVNGDEDATLTVGTNSQLQVWGTDFTQDRTVVLETTGAQEMDRFIISRTGEGAFDLIIGSVKTTGIPSTTVVEYRNSAWALESYTPSGL